MQNKIFTTKTLVLAGLCIALSSVLSMFKLFEMPQGGSVTPASMLPLILFAFVCGPIPGIIVGFAYGLLQVALGGYVIHPAQMLLDYPLAFAALGLSGFIPKAISNNMIRFTLGTLIALIARGFMSVLSGVIFFADYAGDMNVWIYSLGYNYSFIATEFIITAILGGIILVSPVYATLKKIALQ